MAVYDFRGRQVLGYDYDWIDLGSAAYSDKGFLIMSKNEKFGIIDTSGNIVTPFIYRYIFSIRDGYYLGEKKKSSVILDPNGKIVWLENSTEDSIFNAKCDSVSDKSFETELKMPVLFNEIIGNETKIGFIKSNGDTLLTILNGTSLGFDNSLAWVDEVLDKNTKAKRDLGYIDIYGTEYWED
jgi:hypothetical protein